MDSSKQTEKPSELSELSATINELVTSKKSVDDAIAEAEHKLKILRLAKKMLDVDAEPKPRTKKQKTEPAAATKPGDKAA